MRFIRPAARPAARGAATASPPAAAPQAAPVPDRVPLLHRSPLTFGYLVALGAVGAVVTGLALYGLRSILFSVFLALFATVGLDPLIRWFQRHGMRRGWAIVTVIVLLVALLVAIVWIVVPLVVSQVQALATAIPAEVARLRDEGWFDQANASSNGVLGQFVSWVQQQAQSPQLWAGLGEGLLGFGLSVVDGLTTGFFIVVLTIYFIASYDATKQAAYRLVSRSHRDTFVSYAERILQNFGRYLSGMVVLAFFNSVYSIILLVATGVPGAYLIGIAAFFITLIPLIGTVLTTVIMSVLAFIHSPVSGVVVLVLMLIYMQVEAYILTPKVMGKAVQVPGSVVLISALAGSTLFGLPGALVAIPISAGIILIVKELVWPRKEAR
ncbi:AI-2E family transporter [Leifsonia sp. F6_8S_P_1B]|uniref:AI-2E family transporter n=1 Tax=Leifsonia williamsii TaxID=3035919 RepID=A0ABT8KD48_9MICO|nr:AI-2E family transporter [Leifsonia williamsii]MDN4614893.1 AI-2E family transporter [Leifsonia williamsii]